MIDLRNGKYVLSVNNLSLNDPILLKLIWYLTINRIQIELKKEGCVSIRPGVMAPDRREKLQSFGFYSIT